MQNNSLISGIPLPIDWQKLQPEAFREAIPTLIDQTLQTIDEIASLERGSLTYANTLGKYDTCGERLDEAATLLQHLCSVASTDELQKANQELAPLVAEARLKIQMHRGLYDTFLAFAATTEAKTLDAERKRFLELTLEDFRRAGVHLPEEQKQQVAELDKLLTSKTLLFMEHKRQALSAYQLTVDAPSQWSGLPPSFLENKKSQDYSPASPRYTFTLRGDDFSTVLRYADDRQLRQQMYSAYITLCSSGELDNSSITEEILSIRKKMATLLGYPSYAAYALEPRMQDNASTLLALINDTLPKLKSLAAKDRAQIEAFAREVTADPTFSLELWDVAYYTRKFIDHTFRVDDEQLREYFPVAHVEQGLFEIARATFGVLITPNQSLPVWHPAVRAFTATDPDTGALLGYFYTDWSARPSKRAGAWCSRLLYRDGISIAVICGNLSDEHSSAPACITHASVETVLHEFGHLLHELCAKPAVKSFSGLSTQFDFIELPSTLVENFGWEEQSLQKLSRHKKTGESLPKELSKSLIASEKFGAAGRWLGILSMARIDLLLHTEGLPANTSINTFVREQTQLFSFSTLPANHASFMTLHHLFGYAHGYAAGYYSYWWSKVLECDVASLFREAGFENPEIGRQYRQKILAPGNAKPAIELFTDFMGRAPAVEAFFRRLS